MSVVYMFNKPSGCITACSDARHKTVMDYFPESDRETLFPVGRLDKDTEGFLVITDDGALSFDLMKPEHHVKKTYFFWAQGVLNEDKLKEFEKGVSIYKDKDIVTAPATIEILSVATLGSIKELLNGEDEKLGTRRALLPVTSGVITITEGKKHQVKRMIRYAGARVVYLKRIAIGNLHLDPTLPLGAYRALNEEEIKIIKTR